MSFLRNLLTWKALGLAIFTIVLFVFAWRAVGSILLQPDLSQLTSPAAKRAIVLFALCFSAATLLRCFRFAYLTQLSTDISWRDCVLSFPKIFFLGAFTPLRAGEGYRAVWVKKRGGDSGAATGLWIAERFTDVVVLLSLFILSISSFGEDSLLNNKTTGLTLLISIGVAYGLIWIFHARLAAISASVPKIGSWLSNVFSAFNYMNRPRQHLTLLLSTLAIWALLAAGFHCVLSIILTVPPPSPAPAMGSIGAVNLAGIMSIIPGNLGSFQAAMVSVLNAVNIAPDEALSAAILIQATGLGVTLVLGLASWGLTAGPPKGPQSLYQ